MDCKFINTEERSLKVASDPHFKGFMIAGENISISFHTKKKVVLNQSFAIGFSILELAKYFMFKTYYLDMKNLLKCPMSVIFSDTDSVLLHTPIEDSDDVVKACEPIMDCSNYDSSHPLHDKSKEKVVGFLKNEEAKNKIEKFVGIRSKTYAYRKRSKKVESRAKGVGKASKRRLSFRNYEECIETICAQQVTQFRLGSKNHQIQLYKSKKVAFSSFDDKRYLLCPIHSVPYGSRLIQESERWGQCHFCRTGNPFDKQ